jgi:M6 family metalloprotease-like protein
VTNQGDLYNAVTIASDWPNHKWQVIVHELAHTIGLIDLYDYGVTENWNDHHRHVGGFDIMGAYQDNLEFLGWSRYLMKWVKDDQVFCTQPSIEKTLIPMQTIGNEVSDSKDLQMIVIPLDRYKVLVIEAKEKNQFCLTCDGLLVYTVDTTIDNGRGAIKVIPIDRSTHIFKNDAMIRVGESLETHSIRISLISASPNGYIVEINRVN